MPPPQLPEFAREPRAGTQITEAQKKNGGWRLHDPASGRVNLREVGRACKCQLAPSRPCQWLLPDESTRQPKIHELARAAVA